jgi:ABC-type uncharacterized transport system fused permease/ATPase subunit
MISVPLLLSEPDSHKTENQLNQLISERTEEFSMAKNLLNSAADAIERIMSSYKDVIELTGYSHRVFEMLHIFQTINESGSVLKTNENRKKSLEKSSGSVIQLNDKCESISCEAISITTPNGDILVQSLSLKVVFFL